MQRSFRITDGIVLDPAPAPSTLLHDAHIFNFFCDEVSGVRFTSGIRSFIQDESVRARWAGRIVCSGTLYGEYSQSQSTESFISPWIWRIYSYIFRNLRCIDELFMSEISEIAEPECVIHLKVVTEILLVSLHTSMIWGVLTDYQFI